MSKHCFLAVDLGATSGRVILATLGEDHIDLEVLHRFPNRLIEVGGKYYSTYLGNISGWQGIVFGIIPSIILFLGILQLFFNKAERNKLESIAKISASILNLSAILLYILSQQPYPAIFFFSLMIIRTLIFLKNR